VKEEIVEVAAAVTEEAKPAKKTARKPAVKTIKKEEAETPLLSAS
jgi:hypothetical protein